MTTTTHAPWASRRSAPTEKSAATPNGPTRARRNRPKKATSPTLTNADCVAIDATTDPLPVLDADIVASQERIRAAYQRFVESPVEYGDKLNAEKELVGHGNWLSHLKDSGVPERQAQQCMRIASNPAMANPKNRSLLPSALSTQDFMAGRDPEDLQGLFDMELINPDMTEDEVRALFNGHGLTNVSEEADTECTNATVTARSDEDADGAPQVRAEQERAEQRHVPR